VIGPAGSSSDGDALGARPDEEFPADPYPGASPPWSFVHLDGLSRTVTPDPAAHAGWSVAAGGTSRAEDLDAWLARHGAAPMAGRVPLLTFGSNRCPSKLTWLREHLGLEGPVVMLRARVHGLAAVWAAGHRARDGARPATLAVTPGAVEVHSVWMATPEQVAVLDVCEGRGERYDLVRLETGRVITEDTAVVDRPWTYWPASPERAPLLVDGRPVRCSERHQDGARDLLGVAAVPSGDDPVTRQVGAPDPESWPDRVFAYGTLQPGGRAWGRLAPHADGGSVPGWAWGRVHETGRGYPALQLAEGGAGDVAVGTVVTLPAVADLLADLDEYEGPEYRRVRIVTRRGEVGEPGTFCWAWVWDDAAEATAWPVVRGRWGAG
jgi:gamma-glutamylcyclotransferase (GGCT)/AIG2-like uncharacterized protein YtfP